MTSAEPARTTPYSPDIGWRVVWQRLGMGLTFKRIATRPQIGVGTAHRLYTRYAQSGEVAPSQREARPLARKLDELHELFIIGLIAENPGLYLYEICQRINEATGVEVSGSTVCRVLQRNGFTRKKIVQTAKQRCTEFRGAFIAEVLQYPPEFFVWVDETGCDRRDHIQKFGYSLRGVPPVYHRLLVRGKRISAIAAMSSEGLLDVELSTGAVNADKFADFVRGSLIPNMQPFDGTKLIIIQLLSWIIAQYTM